MKKFIYTTLILSLAFVSSAQEDVNDSQEDVESVEKKEDTTRINIGRKEVLVIDKTDEHNKSFEFGDADDSTNHKRRQYEAHWAGLDFGINIMMDPNFNDKFTEHPYWEFDPAKSFTWNLNLIEHKFSIAGPYFGITTGLGFNFNSYAFKDNYILNSTPDSVYAVMDTVMRYSKNKLKTSYLTVPVLLDFTFGKDIAGDDEDKPYLALGVVGGVRMTSKYVIGGEQNGQDFKHKMKDRYNLNPFKLDATVRMGYKAVGIFANYSLLPMFEEDKTTALHPLTFGVTMNF